ncbi:hypothetical protein E2C01_011109 [Portunus trituberculatus]|uniref:Uncharacterized protein n=1 Tax=Portunus trituberculatus TaxID=210409 RepID=A0A5B7DA86_PORTR|nr:hypothetical protein [Portunus trituberculatus]
MCIRALHSARPVELRTIPGTWAQVRPVLEYAPLTWSSCPPSYLTGLDRIQARAQRMVQMRNQDQQLSFQPLAAARRGVIFIIILTIILETMDVPLLTEAGLTTPPISPVK